MAARAEVLRIRDLAGRPRGTGFLVDHEGTVLTSHEAVDGLARVVVHAPGAEATCLVGADAVTPLADCGLAVVRVPELRGGQPHLIAGGEPPAAGTPVRVQLPRDAIEGEATGLAAATYTATDAFHLIEPALELTLDDDGGLGVCGHAASGAPVTDPDGGAVLAVLATAMHGSRTGRCYAVLPRAVRSAVLAEVLAANGAAVAGFGRDLNLAGVRQLAAATLPEPPAQLVERPAVRAELDAFLAGDAHVLALVGDPGTGRTTELNALAHRTDAPAVRLRGADLRVADAGVRDALDRALGDESPETAAALAHAAGSPLLVLLDAPEEMPPVLARDLAAWSAQTGDWLRLHGVRLVLASRPEYWEYAGAQLPEAMLHRPAVPSGTLPPCLRVGGLTPREAAKARARYGIPGGAVHPEAARHPLALRLLADVRAASAVPPPGVPRRWEILDAWLDLRCLAVAERMAPDDVRRTAVRIAGRVHEAARRCLGPGQGELDRASFEELFPWLGGLAEAVLAAGLLVPAGSGYRFAHEELGDWLQGAHLDVDAALGLLAHPRPVPGPRGAPVPPHRIGPLIEALLLVERRQGAAELRARLEELVWSVEEYARTGAGTRSGGSGAGGNGARTGGTGVGGPGARTRGSGAGGTGAPGTSSGRRGKGAALAAWWASHLLGETLLRVPDARPYLPVLRLLTERMLAHPHSPVLESFGPSFWHRLPLTTEDRIGLLRLLVPADDARPSRFLAAAGELLAADPAAVQPLLTHWFDDDRPLPGPSPATVADAAQALLHTHRRAAVDDLTDALVTAAHPRADELLAALCEDEPSAMCRAVDRWAHDMRAERHTAAAVYGLRAVRHAVGDADRELLSYAAQSLLSLPAEATLYGAALAILVRDPRTRPTYLAHALSLLTAGDPHLTPADFGPALTSHPDPVLAAFGARLEEPGSAAADVLRTLAEERAPVIARRSADMARGYAERHPEGARAVAEFLDARLNHGPRSRSVTYPLAVELLRTHPPAVRRAVARVLPAPGTRDSRPLRRELLAVLLDAEQDPEVLTTLLAAVAEHTAHRAPWRTRDLVHRIGELLGATPDGATAFDTHLLTLAASAPRFAAQLRAWLTESPDDWSAVVGPSTQVTLGAAGPRRVG
ncbi:serine protease [Streptomyces sp. NPDC051940]|uniref:serine protease n=1 Tax=Streptomyces sp. NPDC051940 TaxID=3155675 RepID=UPI003442DBEC